MCGIAGLLDTRTSSSREALCASVRNMADAVSHRGPDSAGTWVDETAGIALGHRRLAIVDLSTCGHQPMLSATGRLCIAFNGEIYNFRELRTELAALGHAFRGHSDTEVLLEAIERWGVAGAVSRAVGMFAFALWDREERRLFLARDRMGEKPLYYGIQNGLVFFASELKAFKRLPNWSGKIDRDALTLFVRDSYVGGPRSIYEGVYKLPPGSFLQMDAGAAALPEPTTYWSLRDVALRGLSRPFAGSPEDAVDELEHHLTTSVRGQMIADVPLGAFLSGGIDSSTVVALMRNVSDTVRTFSIGFSEGGFNEADAAKRVANYLGTQHTEMYVTPEQARDVIPALPEIYDEPFADPSQIPTHLVSRLARKHVTVSLSGDGGDELFGGYNRYRYGARAWKQLSPVSYRIRQGASRSLLAVSPSSWDRLSAMLRHVSPRRFEGVAIGDRVHKVAALLATKDRHALHVRLMSHWPDPNEAMLDHYVDVDRPAVTALGGAAGTVDEMMFADAMSYLPDDILAKVDRAAMAVSLETRVPLLDHRVVEFAWSLPLELKIRAGEGKWPLRQVLYRHVPKEFFDRPKMGFGVPIGIWLRGPLREWAEDLLTERRLAADGFFRVAVVRRYWQEHLGGTRNWQYGIWNILMFQAWLEHARQAHSGYSK